MYLSRPDDVLIPEIIFLNSGDTSKTDSNKYSRLKSLNLFVM